MKRITLAASVLAISLGTGQVFAQSGSMAQPAGDQNAMSQSSDHMSSSPMSPDAMHMQKNAKASKGKASAAGMSGPASSSMAAHPANNTDSMSSPH